MKKIEYNIYNREGKNASNKAKADVSSILSRLGYTKLYKPASNRIIRIIQQFISILLIPKDSKLFIQYRSNIVFFYRLLNKFKYITKYAVIHDLDSLQTKSMTIEEEVHILNGFDFIISHNTWMTKYMKENGVKSKIVELDIFDYLLDSRIKINGIFNKYEVFFAGNLAKSKFLEELFKVAAIKFNLYGLQFDGIEKIISQENVEYKGSFMPEELISNLEGGWGLVWDGDTIETCSGLSGEYLKYNNPHKVSMCIVSERPIIIWNKAAMADYIVTNGLGIGIDNLKDLKITLEGISSEQYKVMKTNVLREKKRLINGKSLQDAIKKIES